MELTNDQLQFFSQNGYIVLENIFLQKEIAQMRSEATRVLNFVINCSYALQKKNLRLMWWRLKSGEPYVFKVKPLVDLSLFLHQVAHDDRLLKPLSQLLNCNPILIEDKINYKRKLNMEVTKFNLEIREPVVFNHTDSIYFQKYGFHGPTISSAICMDDCFEENGTLRVWAGTHLKNIVHTPTERDGPIVKDEELVAYKSTYLNAKAGSILMWDARTVHCSNDNKTDDERRLLIFAHTHNSENNLITNQNNALLRFNSTPLEWQYQLLKDQKKYQDIEVN